MSEKYTIRHRIFGDDYLEDEKGNEIELEKPLFGDPYYKIDGKEVYPKEGGQKLEERTILGGGDTYEKKEGICTDHYEKEGLCFITTACVTSMGLSDNCEELTILRKFRKDHLEGTQLGNTILQEYKSISKKILDWIERQDNRANLYFDLYQRLVCGSINLIKCGKIDEAINHYKKIVKEYERVANQ